MITTSTPARWQASSPRACALENCPSASRNSEPPFPSRVPSRSVYTHRSAIEARYGSRAMPSDVSVRASWSWRLADRRLERAQPLAVGIVNVTDDSMYEGARSETVEGAIADGRSLVE